MQSYQNVSNSQLKLPYKTTENCCKRLCKVIKMLAIHNLSLLKFIFLNAANAFAKLSKCQQFTTISAMISRSEMLQTLLQSYQNVSNSQREKILCYLEESCKRFCKVIKMLAIHNLTDESNSNIRAANAFAKLSKCQQFTTSSISKFLRTMLQTLLQSYQNVSNSQRTIKCTCKFTGCKRFCKVIKMLAIHNSVTMLDTLSKAANAFAKLSKCQQFTTIHIFRIIINKLQTLLQSYQNVSNSQQI